MASPALVYEVKLFFLNAFPFAQDTFQTLKEFLFVELFLNFQGNSSRYFVQDFPCLYSPPCLLSPMKMGCGEFFGCCP